MRFVVWALAALINGSIVDDSTTRLKKLQEKKSLVDAKLALLNRSSSDGLFTLRKANLLWLRLYIDAALHASHDSTPQLPPRNPNFYENRFRAYLVDAPVTGVICPERADRIKADLDYYIRRQQPGSGGQIIHALNVVYEELLEGGSPTLEWAEQQHAILLQHANELERQIYTLREEIEFAAADTSQYN